MEQQDLRRHSENAQDPDRTFEQGRSAQYDVMDFYRELRNSPPSLLGL